MYDTIRSQKGVAQITDFKDNPNETEEIFDSHMLIMRKVVRHYTPMLKVNTEFQYCIVLSTLLFWCEWDLRIREMRYFAVKDIRDMFHKLFTVKMHKYINTFGSDEEEVREKDLSTIISQSLRKFSTWGIISEFKNLSGKRYQINPRVFMRAIKNSRDKYIEEYELIDNSTDVYDGIFELFSEGGIK